MDSHRPAKASALKQIKGSAWKKKNVITYASSRSRKKRDQTLPDTSAIPWLEPVRNAKGSVS